MTEKKYSKVEIIKAIKMGFENGKKANDTEIDENKANYMAGYAEGFIEGLREGKQTKSQEEQKVK